MTIGTPVQAIAYALTLGDYAEMQQFLTDWQEGDVSTWAEYRRFIAPAADRGMVNPYAKKFRKDHVNGN